MVKKSQTISLDSNYIRILLYITSPFKNAQKSLKPFPSNQQLRKCIIDIKAKNKYELYRKILCVKDMASISFCKRDSARAYLERGPSTLFNPPLPATCILCSVMKIYIIYAI